MERLRTHEFVNTKGKVHFAFTTGSIMTEELHPVTHENFSTASAPRLNLHHYRTFQHVGPDPQRIIDHKYQSVSQ